MLLRQRLAHGKGPDKRRFSIDRAYLPVPLAMFQRTHIKDSVQQPRQPDAFLMDRTDKPLTAIFFQILFLQQDLEEERIEVIGVRTSWLTWLRKPSFC